MAEKSGASAINLAHLFAALLDDVWGAVATFLVQHGVDVGALAAAARAVAFQLQRRIRLPTSPAGSAELYRSEANPFDRSGELR